MGKKRVIFIGFAEALAAPEVAWDLLHADFQIVAFTRRESRTAMRSCSEIKFIEITAPDIDVSKAVRDLQNAAHSIGAASVLPLDDRSVWLCDRASSALDIPIAGPVGDLAKLALDKRLQIQTAYDAGFNVPATRYVATIREVLEIDTYPIIFKPALAVVETGGQLHGGTMHFCSNRNEAVAFTRIWNEYQPMIAQPVLTGVGEGLFGLAGKESVRFWSAHRRIRMMNPHGSGSSACMSLPLSDQPVANAELMLKKAQWQGMFMIELLRDRSDIIWFMELNGRAWGSMALANQIGYHYPAWTVKQRIDPGFQPSDEVTFKHITARHLGRELVHLLMVLRGPKFPSIGYWPSRWKTFIDIFHIKRQDRWYNWRQGCIRFFVEDTVKTLWDQVFHKSR